ncbi:MAG: 50S ribosomal protein L10 [Armatimonadota bacterium]|nr:50S ribosomal protein L10 [Armatimonadota bacterium]
MPRPEKVTEVEQLQVRLKTASAVIFTDYRGLTVAEITQLRSKLREAGAEYRVLKNRLFGIAGKSVGLEGFGPMLEGPTAAAFVADDPISVAKVLQEFIRQTRKLAIKGSVISGRLYDEQRTRALAELPGRRELLAKTVGSIAAPLSGLAGVLSALPRNLVYALDQIRKQRSAA